MIRSSLKRFAAVSLAAATALTLGGRLQQGRREQQQQWRHHHAVDPQRRQRVGTGRDQRDRQRLQRQPDQVQGRGAGLPAGLLQPVGRRGGRLQETAVHPGHRRTERAELGVGEVPRPARPGWTTSCRSTCPSVVGKWNGKTYSFGFYDVALAMFARKSVLEREQHPDPDHRQAVDGGRVRRRAGHPQGQRASSTIRWTCATATPVSGGPTPTPRSCRASAVT